MTAFIPFLIPMLLGYFALTALLRSAPIRYKNLFLSAASLPTGFGICSVILFFSLWTMPSQAKLISISASIAATLILGSFLFWGNLKAGHCTFFSLISSFKTLPRKFLLAIPKSKAAVLKLALLAAGILVFFAALWAMIQFFTLSVSTNITGGWDARYMWSLKAKLMFRSPEAWQTMFHPTLSWSHSDYPLLWPGTLAWGWNCLGVESLLWPPWVSLSFYISTALILVWYLADQISPTSGYLGGTFFFTLMPPLFWSIQQYADIPVTFFMTTSGLTLITALRSGQNRLFLISGLMAGFAAWTKNEGLFFVFWTGILLAGLKTFKKRIPFLTPSSLKAFLTGLSLPLFWILAFKFFLGKTSDYFGAERSAYFYLTTVRERIGNAGVILQAFWDQMSHFTTWKGLWLFFFLSCFISFFKKTKNSGEGILLAIIFLINFDYFAAFLTSPYNLQWHFQTALQRLLTHTAPLALAFSFEILTFRKNVPKKSG